MLSLASCDDSLIAIDVSELMKAHPCRPCPSEILKPRAVAEYLCKIQDSQRLQMSLRKYEKFLCIF